MKFYVLFFLGLFIIFPAVIGWVRYKKISSAYLPFLIWVWVGAINEVLNTILIIGLGKYNVINTNLYQLIEALLILWQFKKWHLLGKDKSYIAISIAFFISWFIENLVLSKFYLGFNSYFRIFYSFVLVLMSINMLNQILMKERTSLIKNPIFVICILFVVMFTYAALVETFWAYGLNMSIEFTNNLQNIFVMINLVCNVIFAFVILWMPKRQAFTLQF